MFLFQESKSLPFQQNAPEGISIKTNINKVNTLAFGLNVKTEANAFAASYGVKSAQDKTWFGGMLGAIANLPSGMIIPLDAEWTQGNQIKAAYLRDLLLTDAELKPYLSQMVQLLADPPDGKKLSFSEKLQRVASTIAYAKIMGEQVYDPKGATSDTTPNYTVEIRSDQNQGGKTDIADLSMVICGLGCAQFNFSQMKDGIGKFKKGAEEMRKFSVMSQKNKESYVNERMGAGAWKAISDISSKIISAYEKFVKETMPSITDVFTNTILADMQNRDTITFNQGVNKKAYEQSNDFLQDWNDKRSGFF